MLKDVQSWPKSLPQGITSRRALKDIAVGQQLGRVPGRVLARKLAKSPVELELDDVRYIVSESISNVLWR